MRTVYNTRAVSMDFYNKHYDRWAKIELTEPIAVAVQVKYIIKIWIAFTINSKQRVTF